MRRKEGSIAIMNMVVNDIRLEGSVRRARRARSMRREKSKSDEY